MEKRFVSMFVLLLSALLAQNVMAQSSNVVFEETFATGLGGFKVEGYNGQYNDIWSFDGDCARADGYMKLGDSETIENYLVSPEIQLGDKDYQARFEHCCDFFRHMENEVGFAVREVNGQWIDIKITKFWQGMFTVADKMSVPAALKGKTIQFGFKYTAPGGFKAGIWKIKNFSVEVASEQKPGKADPGISFSGTNVTYDLGNPDPFQAPALLNVFNVPVKFSSGNEAVATVDDKGQVTILAKGTTTITATTVETDKFKVGTASYNLTVTDVNKEDPTLKDPEISYDVTTVKYEIMSSEMFAAPELHNPHGVTVKYYSDNTEVATVDQQTGVVIVNKTGTTVIKALSEKNGSYYASYAKYTLNVVDNTILYVGKDFADEDLKGFTEEGEGAGKLIWMPTIYGGWIQANGFNKCDPDTAAYMVSPAVKLDLNGNNLSFTHTGYNFPSIQTMRNTCTVWMREVGSEWKQLQIEYPSDNFAYIDVLTSIPEEFNGKTVQVGFKYVCDGSSGTWSFKDVYFRRNNVKPAAALSFSAEKVDFDMTAGTSYTAPELLNLEGLSVTYSSSNENVATVEPLTGEVTVKAVGSAKICATSQESDKYAQTTVSYLLNVNAETGIDAVRVDAYGSQQIYDIQGRRLSHAQSGLYIVNGKKVLVRKHK